VIIAGISGILFLFNEFNRYSFLMGTSFIIVVMSEFYYLYSLKSMETKGMKN
jgi:inner membrane protein involved in colicin E2 resistance